jgi:undecaprenyl-diphosphatase
MTTIRQFDTAATKLIAKLPENLQKPFDKLGYCTIPSAWAAALVIYSLATQSLTLATVLVLCLLPLATISKFLFRRNRPPTIYAGNMRIKSYSFPSSHAYSAALCGSYFSWLAVVHHLNWLVILLILLIAIIGTSRVYLGAHYPSDVLAGWLVGGILTGVILLCI